MPRRELEREGSPERVAHEVWPVQSQHGNERGQGVGVVGDAERRWRRHRSPAAGRVPGHDRPLVRERELVPPHPVIAEEAVEQEEWAPLADTLIGDLAAIDLDTPQGVLTSGHLTTA